ncbi:MAG: hypothetical protein ACPGUV_00760 [Polyangiales bacterium]
MQVHRPLGAKRPHSRTHVWLPRCLLAVLCGLTLWLLGGPQAAAQSLLSQAKARADEARFSEALALLQRAERSHKLSRPALRQLFEQRAVVHFALRDFDGAKRDLKHLAVVAPKHRLTAAAPPALHRAFAQAVRAQQNRPFRLRVEHTQQDATLTLRLRTLHPPSALLRSVHLYARRAGAPDWEHSAEQTLALDAGMALGRVEYFAQAWGPGDVVLQQVGSRETPQSLLLRPVMQVPAAPSPAVTWGQASETSSARQDEGGGRRWLWWVGAGGVVAVTVATVLALTLRSSGTPAQTQVGGPVIVR